MRKPIIAGNWKMNNTVADTVKLLDELKPLVADVTAADVVVCVPFTDIAAAAAAAKGTNIHVGAQNVAWADKEDLIIRFRPTPHPDAPSLLQCLDPESAAVRWTLQGTYDGDLVKTADGLYLLQGAKLYRISEGRQPPAEPQRLF